ncbi:hypothetical protein GCM10009837_30610 [Streptomyces durmitorensis]|uniref:Uncharacterized protein n=1 Tax=Streptomyces durmitorensis TaxID=319947 RepID=A0ABY4PZV5_9ACTN|nr:SAVMC3_10250 family protein [Streptomyces durmitorensis]UQT58799.1 hypothetical protein M4V62_29160 [Streptomyces durmitorensis]
MRELIYLSDSKLQQFMPKPRRWRGPESAKIVTPLGELNLSPRTTDPIEARAKHFERVVEHIELNARWFQTARHQAGQWIWFEAPLNYVNIPAEGKGALLFVDPEGAYEQGYPRSSPCRLLLHGSITNLIAAQSAVVDASLPTQEEVGQESAARFDAFLEGLRDSRSPSDPTWFMARLAALHDANLEANVEARSLLGELRDTQNPMLSLTATLPLSDSIESRRPSEKLQRGVEELVHSIDRQVIPETASWVQGYARVSAHIHLGRPRREFTQYLVASPLYVERMMEP